jgi:hypothetical protein
MTAALFLSGCFYPPDSYGYRHRTRYYHPNVYYDTDVYQVDHYVIETPPPKVIHKPARPRRIRDDGPPPRRRHKSDAVRPASPRRLIRNKATSVQQSQPQTQSQEAAQPRPKRSFSERRQGVRNADSQSVQPRRSRSERSRPPSERPKADRPARGERPKADRPARSEGADNPDKPIFIKRR